MFNQSLRLLLAELSMPPRFRQFALIVSVDQLPRSRNSFQWLITLTVNIPNSIKNGSGIYADLSILFKLRTASSRRTSSKS